jgi:methionyl-tRNA synthetase
MAYLLATLSLLMMLGLMHKFKLVQHCKKAIRLAGQCNTMLFDQALSDLEKEQKSQTMAKLMLRQLALICLAGGSALLLPLLPLYLLSALEIIQLTQIFDVMMSLEGIIGFSAISLLFFFKVNRD